MPWNTSDQSHLPADSADHLPQLRLKWNFNVLDKRVLKNIRIPVLVFDSPSSTKAKKEEDNLVETKI